MIVELISVGTELLLGNIVNTNAAYLAEECAKLGLSLYYQTVVGDNGERLKETVSLAASRSDVVILTGGLGPTKDDLTKEVVAAAAGRELVEDAHTRKRIEQYFQKIQSKLVTDNNWKQAMIPQGAIVLDNHNGTAPGLILEEENTRFILLPGPPNELEPLFAQEVYPYLDKLIPETIYSETVKICGMGESFVETAIEDMIKDQTNPTIAPYAKTGEVHLRVTAKAQSAEAAREMIAPVVKELKERFGDNVYSTKENETLEASIVKLLADREWTLTTAESCTGGLLAGRIVNVPGASEILKQGFITYSNKSKRKLLGVKKSTLKEHGAVSAKTAKEMAKGGAFLHGADVCVSITGIAGPDGGTDEKPVGLVYIGCRVNDKTTVKEYRLKGDRHKIRNYSVVYALTLLRECILAE